MKHIKLFEIFNNSIVLDIMNSKVGDIIDSNDVYDYVYDLHRTDSDFDDGDITDRIFEFNKYVVKYVPLDEISTGDYELVSDWVKEYIDKYKETKNYPPIILGHYYGNIMGYDIIDGNHRANSLKDYGLKNIKSLVGINN